MISLKNKTFRMDLKKTQKEMHEAKPTIFQEKYEAPTTEVIEMELEGTILNMSDMKNNAW